MIDRLDLATQVDLLCADSMLPPEKVKRRKNGHPEHNTQIQCRRFCAENVLCQHRFLGFDRGPARTKMQHEYERRRGLRRAQSDTLVKAKGFVGIWIEVKRKGERPTEDQRGFGADMVAVGDAWDWADSVTMYAEALDRHGIPLRTNWRLNAEHLDRLLLAGEMKRKGSAPKSYRKPRAEKSSAARVAAVHRSGYWKG